MTTEHHQITKWAKHYVKHITCIGHEKNRARYHGFLSVRTAVWPAYDCTGLPYPTKLASRCLSRRRFYQRCAAATCRPPHVHSESQDLACSGGVPCRAFVPGVVCWINGQPLPPALASVADAGGKIFTAAACCTEPRRRFPMMCLL